MRPLHRLTLVDEWIELIQIKSGLSVLDIGPGPGVFTQHYGKVVGSTGKVTTLEKSKEAIAHLTEELKQPVNGIERRNHRYKDLVIKLYRLVTYSSNCIRSFFS